MRRVATAAVLVIAAFLAYRYYDGTFAPEKKYKDFAEEILKRHYDAAAAMTDGLSTQDLAKQGTQEKVGGGTAMFQTLFPSRFDIESRTATSLGVTLHAVQTCHPERRRARGILLALALGIPRRLCGSG
jgi:hypothetical protein